MINNMPFVEVNIDKIIEYEKIKDILKSLDEDFKFTVGATSNFVYTAKKLYVPDPIYIVMWECQGELQCVNYPVERAMQYIEEGSWRIVQCNTHQKI